MNQWYLIQFKPNSHRLAERNLHRQGINTFLPMQKITRRKASRFVSDLKPLFSVYMFVSVNSEQAPWRSINSTIGVSRLVSFEGKLKPLPIQLICNGMQIFKLLLLNDYFRILSSVYVNVQQLVQYQSKSCVLNTTSALITIKYRA